VDIKQIREKTVDELERTERELYDRLFKLRFQLATNQIENPGQIGLVRKELARVKTIINEKRRASPTAGAGAAVGQG